MTQAHVLSGETRRFLEKHFPGDAAAFTPEEMFVYGTDASRRHAMPTAVVRPATVGQIQELLAFAEANRLPILPRGRGTGAVNRQRSGRGTPWVSGLTFQVNRKPALPRAAHFN